LRWSLSKLRPLLTDEHGPALTVDREGIDIDRRRVAVDVLAIQEAVEQSTTALVPETLQVFESQLDAGYLTGLDDLGSVQYQLWLESAREDMRRLHGRVIDALIALADTPARALRLARKRVALDPADPAANRTFLRLAFATGGRTRAQAALSQMRAHYRAECLNDGALISAWHELTRAAP
jgi:DNA-binding SARP family transcriptional activator